MAGKSKSKTTVKYRDAGSGEFITERTAKQRSPNTVIRERVPKPGYGDTKK